MPTPLECFDPDYEGLFDRLAEAINKGTAPSDEELMVILRWKLGRTTKSNARTIHEHRIEIGKALLQAGNDETASAAVQKLIQFKGIKLRVASALLTACYPDRYTVLDYRALSELQAAGVARRHQPWSTNANDWNTDVDGYLHRYLPAVREFQEKDGLPTLRDADRALWGSSVLRTSGGR